MYLPEEFKKAVRDIYPSRIVHVGAHLGEEAAFYRSLPATVVWIEANPRLLPKLASNVKRYGQQVIQALLSDESGKEVTFNIANNGQSSSFLPLKVHLDKHPDVAYIDEIQLITTRLDDLNLNCNILNLDVQGAERHVIRGGLETIKNVQVIYAEINFLEMYEGCCLLDSFDSELATLGFSRIATHDTGAGWGDAIYRRD